MAACSSSHPGDTPYAGCWLSFCTKRAQNCELCKCRACTICGGSSARSPPPPPSPPPTPPGGCPPHLHDLALHAETVASSTEGSGYAATFATDDPSCDPAPHHDQRFSYDLPVFLLVLATGVVGRTGVALLPTGPAGTVWSVCCL